MSADNGIYILKTKDGQYRVTHAQAIENIYEDYYNNRYNPLEVVRVWGDCKYTRDMTKAYQIADAMQRKQYTEYGIKTFEYRKPWKYIVEDAKVKAESLKENILDLVKFKSLDSYNKYRLELIEKILNM